MNRSCLLSIAVLTASASAVLAHITLEKEEAPAESLYKAVLRVPHGCEGSATVKVRVQIPEGVIAVKPMPKAGWQLEMVKGKYEKSYNYYGTPMTEGIKAIRGPVNFLMSITTSSYFERSSRST